MKELEIYFRDLNEETQEKVKKLYGIKNVEKETNWNIMCLHILYNCVEE